MARKSRNHRLDLPALELECMKALWARGQSTVHGIRADLLPVRPLAYTTVMTVMDRLTRKGVVGREKHGRAHVYRPLVSDAEVRDFTLDRLVDDFFRGSRDRLRRHLEGGGSQRPLPEAPEVSPRNRPAPPSPSTQRVIDPSLL
ncbi:MAG TPA: BlaI/MecI/CopY family transcriptional regulator [Terriglobia bacterium]|nr:BlaI/MecI/CopY family transcriptional regulator [Terriglobia bacterium]